MLLPNKEALCLGKISSFLGTKMSLAPTHVSPQAQVPLIIHIDRGFF